MNNTPTPRKQFEEWAKSEGYSLTLAQYASDIYECALTRAAWESWRALSSELTAAREEINMLKSKYADHHAEAERITSEINAITEQLKEMTARAMSLAAHLPPDTLCGDVQKWRDDYKLVTEQRDRLAEALREYREALHDGPENCSYKMYEAVDEFAEQALQSLNQNAQTDAPTDCVQ